MKQSERPPPILHLACNGPPPSLNSSHSLMARNIDHQSLHRFLILRFLPGRPHPHNVPRGTLRQPASQVSLKARSLYPFPCLRHSLPLRLSLLAKVLTCLDLPRLWPNNSVSPSWPRLPAVQSPHHPSPLPMRVSNPPVMGLRVALRKILLLRNLFLEFGQHPIQQRSLRLPMGDPTVLPQPPRHQAARQAIQVMMGMASKTLH